MDRKLTTREENTGQRNARKDIPHMRDGHICKAQDALNDEFERVLSMLCGYYEQKLIGYEAYMDIYQSIVMLKHSAMATVKEVSK